MDNSSADKVVQSLHQDYKMVGTRHVHSWYAYAIIGLVFGMAMMIIYISNRNAQFSPSHASEIGTGSANLPTLTNRNGGSPAPVYGNTSTVGTPDVLWTGGFARSQPMHIQVAPDGNSLTMSAPQGLPSATYTVSASQSGGQPDDFGVVFDSTGHPIFFLSRGEASASAGSQQIGLTPGTEYELGISPENRMVLTNLSTGRVDTAVGPYGIVIYFPGEIIWQM